MDVKTLLISRGEILVVVLVALLCAWLLYGIATDPDSRPDTGREQIDADIQRIETAKRRQQANRPRPEPRSPADSLQAMRQRLSIDLASPQVRQWISRHPNVFAPPPPDNLFLYAYQILTPRLRPGEDAQPGTFPLVVELPAPINTEQLRLGGGGDFSVTRDIFGREPVTNRARLVGLQVQQRIGGPQSAWEPLGELGGDGVLRDITVGESIMRELFQVQSMQDYAFRARLLVAGTGYEDGGGGVGNAVVMYAGRLDEVPDWARFSERWRALAEKDEDLSLAETVQDPARFGISLEERERLYAGQWSDPLVVEPESDLRLGLRSVSDFDGNIRARIWVRKLLRDPSDPEKALGWTPPDEDFRVTIGEELGGPVELTLPNGRNIEVDLSTGMLLEAVEKDVERVLYYEVDLERNEQGDRVLAYKPYTRAVDVAVLRNQETGKEVRLIELQRLTRRPDDIVYPPFPGGATNYHEQDMLNEGDPADYQAPRSLEPEEPVWHEPEDRLLWEYDPFAQTNQRYLEFPDGRLVYYDHINREIFVVDMVAEEEPAEEPVDDEGDGEDDVEGGAGMPADDAPTVEAGDPSTW